MFSNKQFIIQICTYTQFFKGTEKPMKTMNNKTLSNTIMYIHTVFNETEKPFTTPLVNLTQNKTN